MAERRVIGGFRGCPNLGKGWKRGLSGDSWPPDRQSKQEKAPAPSPRLALSPPPSSSALPSRPTCRHNVHTCVNALSSASLMPSLTLRLIQPLVSVLHSVQPCPFIVPSPLRAAVALGLSLTLHITISLCLPSEHYSIKQPMGADWHLKTRMSL
eukprot:763135-Hanusia_phi.AAC.4